MNKDFTPKHKRQAVQLPWQWYWCHPYCILPRLFRFTFSICWKHLRRNSRRKAEEKANKWNKTVFPRTVVLNFCFDLRTCNWTWMLPNIQKSIYLLSSTVYRFASWCAGRESKMRVCTNVDAFDRKQEKVQSKQSGLGLALWQPFPDVFHSHGLHAKMHLPDLIDHPYWTPLLFYCNSEI